MQAPVLNPASRSLTLLLCLLLFIPGGLLPAQESDHDFYLEGWNVAQTEYKGGGAVASGLISGFALGLLGWGVGYLVVMGLDVRVPDIYTSAMTPAQKFQFDTGYKDYVKQARKRKFSLGGGIGTLGAVIYVYVSR